MFTGLEALMTMDECHCGINEEDKGKTGSGDGQCPEVSLVIFRDGLDGDPEARTQRVSGQKGRKDEDGEEEEEEKEEEEEEKKDEKMPQYEREA
ncbi:hypothetical protein E2C01_061785 [Portunus trituberculatus]|uniref:Uncharacterized protein n=1 Tax=Portunus trituberculatus TaxID=210409 RepID=A0A5B7HFC6_PORTR|nr:hypothetical protein [Portunus trituberculatus]